MARLLVQGLTRLAVRLAIEIRPLRDKLAGDSDGGVAPGRDHQRYLELPRGFLPQEVGQLARLPRRLRPGPEER